MSFVRAVALLSALLALTSATAVGPSAAADQVKWRTNVDAARVEAADTGKLILLHFYAPWCGPCKVLDRDVFSQPHVDAELAKNFIPVKVDADTAPALASAYGVSRLPTDVILTPQGAPLASLACPKEAAAYLQQLGTYAEHFRQTAQKSNAAPGGPAANAAYAGLNFATPAAVNAQAAATAPGATTGTVENRYGMAQPNATAQTATPVAGGAQPVYQQQMTAAASQQPTPQAVQNPYVAAPTTPPAAERAGSNRYATASAQPTTPTATTTTAAAASTTPAAPVTPNIAPPAMPAAPASSQVAAVAWPPQLPPDAQPLGLDGYCPVTLRTAGKWVRGNPNVGIQHRGRTYLFASDAERQQFNADPDSYSPVFSGYDPVVMLESGREVAGARKFGCTYGQQMYLFSSEETLSRFKQNPTEYAAGVRQAMSRLNTLEGGGVIRR